MSVNRFFQLNENLKPCIGGVALSDLRKNFKTPLYVLDMSRVKDTCEAYVKSLEENYGFGMICYASKALSCKGIYRAVNDKGLGCDVVSGGELYTALSADFPAEKIVFHGNNKSYGELTEAISAKVGYIVVDAFSEVDDIDEICRNNSAIQNILIRVNPGIEAHTHHYIQTSKPDSKFGFSIADGQAEKVIKYALSKQNVRLAGLHCHIGSQIFDKKSFILAVDKMTDFYKKIKDDLGVDLDVLNLGGGFGIWYSDGDKDMSAADYVDYISEICRRIKEKTAENGIKKPYLIFEPGRSIVGGAGITLYTAGRIKELPSVGKKYIAIDGGMFENPRFALYQAKYTVVAPEKEDLPKTEKYTLAGKCCESGDIIAEDCLLPEIKEGDLLAVLSTGAYNYSMASNYNRNLIPPIVAVENGKAQYLVKPQTYEDLISRDV